MLIVSQQDVERTFTMPVAIEAMRDVLIALDRGEALQPLRSSVDLPGDRGKCWLMPAYAGAPASLGVKVLTAFPGNAGTPHATHQGAVLLFGEHGELLALIDATSITAIRTAAVSAVATDVLARPDAARLAILGSGAQAASHLVAMSCVRKLSRVTLWSRNADNAERFVRFARDELHVDVYQCDTVADAVLDADIICTTTAADTPILEAELVRPGAHINAVGSGSATARELSGSLVKNASVYVDRMESALSEAGEIVLAIADGVITTEDVAGEVGAVLTGRLPGRRATTEITLFKSVGLGAEDVASARAIYSACLKCGAGTRVNPGSS